MRLIAWCAQLFQDNYALQPICVCYVELEVTLGASEPTLAEYILDKYEVSNGSAAVFRTTLQKEAGIDGIHVDRLHSLISTLKVVFPCSVL